MIDSQAALVCENGGVVESGGGGFWIIAGKSLARLVGHPWDDQIYFFRNRWLICEAVSNVWTWSGTSFSSMGSW